MSKYHLLVVDDDINRCRMLEYKIKKGGYKVTYTTDPKEALSIFSKENIDVVISDIRMGKMNGLELLEELKKADPLINVILITAFGKDENLLLKALRKGAFDFLEKVEDIDILMNIIERAIKDRDIKINFNYLVKKNMEASVSEFVGKDEKILNIINTVKNIAGTESTVLITGESGTGKEIVAQMIHRLSSRNENNFVSFNCAAINTNLIESELFGHKKGAFTGAYTNKDGLFKVANNGTIFLDEIAEMETNMQAKLLRVIQEKEITPIGSTDSIPIDSRIIAATNKDIDEEVQAGRFRLDLFYRLNVIRIDIPALRERKDDIKILFDYYIEVLSKKYGKKINRISDSVYDKLYNYDWPGNVRELINIVERILVIKNDSTIAPDDIPFNNAAGRKSAKTYGIEIETIDRMEKKLIEKVLSSTADKKEASKILGINLSTLYRKMKYYDIKG